MIELTVAMPLYNSKYIAWLAMESLCRQKNVTFDWELIVSEEQNDEMYGEEFLGLILLKGFQMLLVLINQKNLQNLEKIKSCVLILKTI